VRLLRGRGSEGEGLCEHELSTLSFDFIDICVSPFYKQIVGDIQKAFPALLVLTMCSFPHVHHYKYKNK